MKARAGIVSCAIGFLLLGGGIGSFSQQQAQEEHYRQLAEATHGEAAIAGDGDEARVASPSPIPWGELQTINGDLFAWLRVEGTGIDTPVCLGSAKPEGWYLSHDFWGADSALGCPYLSERCDGDDRALILYAHHITGGTAGFSELYDRHEQARFDALGEALLYTERQCWRLTPLCACEVDEGDQLAQRSAFGSNEDFAAWLEALCKRSSAQAHGSSKIAEGAQRAITLVTCSSLLPGQPWRCAVTFAASEIGGEAG